jgi:hypothetical protein
MSTEEIIIRLFCIVADRLHDVKPHRNANLHPSEIVTIGLLYALKGNGYRAFYRWLSSNWRHFFPKMPDYTRMLRLMRDYNHLTDRWLQEPTFFTVMDSYGIELIHPIREGRSPKQVGGKGKSNHRWIVGIKLVPMLNNRGEIVDWSWASADTHDQHFRSIATKFDGETITLTDTGFSKAGAPPSNIKLCKRGTWNERMIIETFNSLATVLFHAKRIRQRVTAHIEARLAYLIALANILQSITAGTSLTWKDFTL